MRRFVSRDITVASQGSRIFTVFLSACFCALMILVIIESGRDVFKIAFYRRAEGVVTSVSVRQLSANTRLYEPRITYEYSVGGRRYAGEQLALGLSATRREFEAVTQASNYRVGERIRVRVSPWNATDAFLLYDLDSAFHLGIALVGLLLFGGELRHAARGEVLPRRHPDSIRRSNAGAALGATALGGAVLYYTFPLMMIYLRQHPVTAVIREVGVEPYVIQAGTEYVPLVTYAYEFRGQQHIAKRRVGEWRSAITRKDSAATLLKPYSLGSTHTALVDPQRPRQPVFKQDVPTVKLQQALRWGLFISICFLTLGLWIWIRTQRTAGAHNNDGAQPVTKAA